LIRSCFLSPSRLKTMESKPGAANRELGFALSMMMVRRYIFLLSLMRLLVYFLLTCQAVMEDAPKVVSTLRVLFVLLGLGAQILSYLGSGYLLRPRVSPGNKVVSIVNGSPVTAAANSVRTRTCQSLPIGSRSRNNSSTLRGAVRPLYRRLRGLR